MSGHFCHAACVWVLPSLHSSCVCNPPSSILLIHPQWWITSPPLLHMVSSQWCVTLAAAGVKWSKCAAAGMKWNVLLLAFPCPGADPAACPAPQEIEGGQRGAGVLQEHFSHSTTALELLLHCLLCLRWTFHSFLFGVGENHARKGAPFAPAVPFTCSLLSLPSCSSAFVCVVTQRRRLEESLDWKKTRPLWVKQCNVWVLCLQAMAQAPYLSLFLESL